MKPAATLAEHLSRTSFFAGLDARDLEPLAARMRPQDAGNGQLVFSRGDEARDLYFVASGRIRLSILSSDGRELSVAHATAGEIFGEIAVLDGGVRTASATAIEPTKLHMLSRAALKQAMEANPRIAEAAIKFLCARLRDTDQRYVSVALHSVEVRLARYILAHIWQSKPDAEGSDVPCDIDMSQSELALLIGASRPKVNVALTKLEELGAIRRSGKRYLCDTFTLEDVAALD